MVLTRFLLLVAAIPAFAGSFSPTAPLTVPSHHRKGVALADGRMFVVGDSVYPHREWPSELFDPATRTWSRAPADVWSRIQQTVTRLADGRVLIAGGLADGGRAVPVASIFDPATNTITTTGNLRFARSLHTAILLPDGRVLIAGGRNIGEMVMTAELYDPVQGTFSEVSNPITIGRYEAQSVLLANGKVLLTGGRGPGPGRSLANAEVFDPALGTFSAVQPMKEGRAYHTMTLLLDGRVLIAGGFAHPGVASQRTFEIFDPLTNSFVLSGDMIDEHAGHAAGRLPDGRVLIAGGSKGQPTYARPTRSAELFDPVTNTFTPTRSLHETHELAISGVLANGRVLIAGSESGMSWPPVSSELFDPADRPPTRGDWNGDGAADVLWSDPVTNAEHVWFFEPSGIAGGAVRRAERSALTRAGVPTVGDFDGDGIADVIHRDPSGNNVLSLMAGYGVLASYAIPAVPAASWRIAAAADFDGDGTDDLLWTEPGHNSIWLMRDGRAAESAPLPDVPANWSFAATGDFDADGKADILWRNPVTGENAIWLIDRYAVKDSRNILTVQDPKYSVAGTGDVDGDGKSDLVWQNDAGGAVAVWLIDGVRAVDGAHIGEARGFAVRQVSDFDADGQADLFLRNPATGENAVWYLDRFIVRARHTQAAVRDGSEVVPPR